ncbi:TIGR03621 family F420-dependent LLM class oxidoreductase [Modestobacter sp. I12A-02628]|uniref:TIGR03621 family F420-dependent LLM class oxidoreductase n=1 Tax=Goekera deserti TaxID=2497753 RepID=A0A7K3WGE6_9ACTN|nr:TIGR03621 family F420-dependent LLM class oxidoreductase [Goekera deserti]MPQ96537.1 TIGR03621 family F420-dependent LLM class oxidoreductase [Goekera deserti]NDI47148.1 TIGR03621 family F420-dependent LLM class oxidoreductase [Goekera deserti]NEL55452.1 TIGR03621 family F420-dependent LLM class oxidoreductase [Goekera deserti]
MAPDVRPFRFAVQAYRPPSGAAWRELARQVEGLGYSALHTSDHYLGPGAVSEQTGHRPVTLAPVPAMAVAAEVTSTLRIGCRMFCVGYHHAYVLAKEVATLAELSGGRTEVGLGAGWLAAEYAAMGIPFPPAGERIAHLAEFVDLLRDFLAGRPADTRGAHVHATDMSPLPLLPSPPPIMIGGGAPRVLRLAGSVADIVSVNFDNRSGVIGAASIAGSGHEETLRKTGWVLEGAAGRPALPELEVGVYFLAVDGGGTTEAELSAQTGLAGEQLRSFPHALVGSVDAVCAELERRREVYGFSYVTVGDRSVEAFAPVVERLTGR